MRSQEQEVILAGRKDMFDKMHEGISAGLERHSTEAWDEWGSAHTHFRDTHPLKGMCFHSRPGPEQGKGPSVGTEKKAVSIDKQEKSDDKQIDRRAELHSLGCKTFALCACVWVCISMANREIRVDVFDPRVHWYMIAAVSGALAVEAIIDLFKVIKK